MENKQQLSFTPGKYLFRANPFTQWVEVTIFKSSNSSSEEELWVQWLDSEIEMQKLINRGEWKELNVG
ncbi:hypothetical protein [Aliikangiella sp. IMCC44359]|uniref:hypothetical protein n=1 Tax=Aliikangiella sp. IMCC44359 TaxID=3459125 RepID=UPI00403AAE7F